MPLKLVATVVVLFIGWYLLKEHSQKPIGIDFPISDNEVKHGCKLLNDRRLSLTTEQFHASVETISDANLPGYINQRQNQYMNEDKLLFDYIRRIQWTDEGQEFGELLNVGAQSSFSIKLIAHKKLNGKTKIFIATLKKEVTVSRLSKLLNWTSTLFGYNAQQRNEMGNLVTDFSRTENHRFIKALMMKTMAEKIDDSHSKDVIVSYSGKNQMDL